MLWNIFSFKMKGYVLPDLFLMLWFQKYSLDTVGFRTYGVYEYKRIQLNTCFPTWRFPKPFFIFPLLWIGMILFFLKTFLLDWMWFSCVDGSSVHYINQRRPMFVLSISFTIFLRFQNIFLTFQNDFVNISKSIFVGPLYQSGKTDNCW